MSDDKELLAYSSLGLGVVAALSIPAAAHLVKQIGNRSLKTEGYEDKDGQSTEEAVKAFSNKLPKVSILVLSITGFCISIATAVLTTLSPRGEGDGLFLENWLAMPAWALLTLQAVCIAASRDSVQAYNLGIYSMLSCVTLATVLAFQDNQIATRLWKHDGLAFAIRAAEILTIICLGFVSLMLPRRPDVYYEGKLVDQLYTVSAWSRYNYSWAAGILRLATKKKNLDLADLPRPNQWVRSKDVTAHWESHNFSHSLWVSIILAHKWAFAIQWALTLACAVLNFAPQWVVLQLLHLLENRHSTERIGYEGWMWAVWLMVVIIAQSWVETLIFWLSWAELCIPIRAQLSSLIFQKAMRRKDVKEAAKKKTPTSTEPTVTGPAAQSGGIEQPPEAESGEDEAELLKKNKQSTVNLIGVDAKRVSDFANFNWFFPSSLFKLIVSLIFLLDLLGWKALVAGFGTMLVITPVNIYFSKLYSDAQDRLMEVRDEKMGVVAEALQGIRQIKFSALEPQWENKIGMVRERELKCVWDAFRFDVMLFACWITSPILLAAVSLAVYAAIHGSLTPSVAFVSLSVFKALELTLSIIPELTTDLLDAWVSIKRIDAYLRGAEISKITQDSDEISFDNASIAWPSDAEPANSEEDPDRFILRHISATFPKGELSVISGKTGSGKSLMLAAILGEVDLLSGTITKPRAPLLHERHDSKANKSNWILTGAVAYVAQIPWIENATVQDNILFGLPFDPYRYAKTIEVCALTKDIEMFSDGDATEIGANGINLSGGQKWRITLARAIYSRAGILVLDDIFSAVDAHVGRHIFEQCLNGELGVGRTRILVTHHVALCESKAKFLMELGDGGVLNAGLVSELESAGTLEQIKSHEEGEGGGLYEQVRDEEESTAVNSEQISQVDIEAPEEPLAKVPSKAHQPRKFVEEEKQEEGAIKARVYSTYLKHSGSWPFWTGAVVLFLVVQALTIGRSWWLRIWTGTYEEEEMSNLQANVQTFAHHYNYQQSAMQTIIEPAPGHSERGIDFYLGIYIALSVVASILSTFRWYYIFTGSIRASRELFARLNFIVLRAPLRWLDTVPVGRVLNRFTADFHSVDTHLAYAVAFAANAFLNLLGVVAAGLFVSPVIIVLAFILLAISVMFARQYLHAARSVKRMESITKSPVFEQFGSALTGVLSIRAFNKSQTYIERMYTRLDDWTVATWHLWLFNRWMGWRMSVVGSLFAFFVTIFILLSPDMDSALAGFALSFALEFSGYVMWTVRHYANAELEMNAAERIVEYTELPTEDLGGVRPPAAWPTEGRVEVNDLVVGYADDLPPVLKGLNFSIKRNERVGVIGRTGAGKSSLTLALFRFVEARSGNILIDGVDISKIRLHDLRSRLAIIPQDPVLFSGTVRSNLDPFNNHTDAELFDSLARVHLIAEAETSPGTPVSAVPSDASRKNTNIFRDLSSTISEGGLNLSQGQRQLLCLARAIVSRPKVMVLDEATSAVDMATDALIQRSIREEFGDSTLVVIAHRLSTIADFDRILVLSDGQVAEYGTPRELWEAGENDSNGEKGIFRAMCEQSGEKEVLRRIVYGEDTAVAHEA
ncbi:P-loop containing nucleoside triphosphate hydrolase protein [Xylaria bambusicola]|uniref:P-loop containing nucleoside triphosphate hydrolase protein n=1 Tax=Xylaria bambusicola TaxID=326684 RepID=UPI00200845B6|nr:P-loop containing nucleoside triphosphate hydrolase protein [Xylaria bambusicola]KAI0505818.1 P-loop containing nucleoside triphosphate hydrolase protein [Xylaria bambusicola]